MILIDERLVIADDDVFKIIFLGTKCPIKRASQNDAHIMNITRENSKFVVHDSTAEFFEDIQMC